MHLLPHTQGGMQEDEARFNRFGAHPRPEEPISYDFTQDRGLLHQYFQLREIMYRKIYKADKFESKEDLHDKISHVLLAHQGPLCVGGARITVRESDEEFLLPMETDTFNLKKLPQTVEHTQYRHCEISRFAILSDKYEKDIMYEMTRLLIDKMIDLNVNYLFVKATLPMARNWRRLVTHFGLADNYIYPEGEIDIPAHPVITWAKWYLLRVTVVPVVTSAKKSDARLVTVQQ